MENEIGKFRLYAMRIVFFLTVIGLLPSTFQELFMSAELLEPYYAIAISFWLALSIMAILGIFYPAKMLPILLMQMLYKAIWLFSVGIPLWLSGSIGNTEELFIANAVGVVIDALVIPWVMVFKKYLGKPVW